MNHSKLMKIIAHVHVFVNHQGRHYKKLYNNGYFRKMKEGDYYYFEELFEPSIKVRVSFKGQKGFEYILFVANRNLVEC